jgi:hypothetical protein
MTLYTKSGNIPNHQYCFVERKFLNPELSGVERCCWFAIVAHTGRMWGCHILLESGAVYRQIPPHALSMKENPAEWVASQAQQWDCYGDQFSVIAYRTLYGLDLKARIGASEEIGGSYLFNAVPINDPYSEAPDQDKEFVFAWLDNGRLTIQPTNRILFIDKSFTSKKAEWPTHLRPLSQVYHSE